MIGLTGGIGSGKSTVADLLVARGAALVDTDRIAHDLTGPGGDAIAPIRAAFGDAVIAPDGRMDRAGMRRIGHGSMPALDHPFRPGLDCWVGSTWWGARRAVCEAFVAAPDDALRRHARGMLNCDEFYFHTLACNGGWRIGPSNHWIAPFEGPHPARVATRDLPAIRASGRWFARKFAPDPADLARLAVLGARAGRHAPRRVSALRLA